MRLRDRHVSPRRLLAGGVLLASLAAVGGTAIELWRFGPNRAAAAARVEQQVRRNFDRMTTVLTRVAVGVAMDPEASRRLMAGPDAARALFELVDRRLSEVGAPPDAVALTIYNTAGDAQAWVGRPSDIRAPDRLSGPAAFFVTQTPLGLRLVHILPILDRKSVV